jgi:maltose alpha-D-glucosyltransferase/alpha-amylase
VRNHDELTLDKLRTTSVKRSLRPSTREVTAALRRGLRRRLPPMLDGDQQAIRMVYSLAFSLPGTPVLFYGEEIGMGENLAIEGRSACDRRCSGPTRRTPASRPWPIPEALCRPVVDDERFGPERVNVTRQRRRRLLLNWFERLIRRRRECPEIGFGDSRSSTPASLGPRPPLRLERLDRRGGARARGEAVTVTLALDLPDDADALVDLFSADSHALDDGQVNSTRAERLSVLRVRRSGRRLPP